MSLLKIPQRLCGALWMNKTPYDDLKDSTSVNSPHLSECILHHTAILSLHASHPGLVLVPHLKCFYLAVYCFEHAVLSHCNLGDTFESERILY